MMAPDPNDFDWSALEFEFTEPTDILDVTALSDVELLNLERELVEQLKQRGEMLNTTTDEGREIHSRRAAVRIELARRNLK